MHRLFAQIYGTLIGVLVLFGLLAGGVVLLLESGVHDPRLLDHLAPLAAQLLPGKDAPREDVRVVIEDQAQRLDLDIAVFDERLELMASAGRRLAPPDRQRSGSHWIMWRRGGPIAAMELPDGRRLLVRRSRRPAAAGLLMLALLAVACAVGAYPLVRRLTRRLERLEERVEALGKGDLGARVEVEGTDEVARLARRFNTAAEQIEKLVGTQRHLLAAASHELRSPLARMRVSVERLDETTGGERRRLEKEIGVLDDLIEEILLASRLQAVGEQENREPIELLALVAEECAALGIVAGGREAWVEGDARLLRRLVRNLVENARRHGARGDQAGDEIVEGVWVQVEPNEAAQVILVVEDEGPGVPENQRENVFEPFHRGVKSRGSDGVGLGLALVRRIARHHGGEVRCVEGAGGGARFEVELPRIVHSP